MVKGCDYNFEIIIFKILKFEHFTLKIRITTFNCTINKIKVLH